MLEIATQTTRRYVQGHWQTLADQIVQESPLQLELIYGRPAQRKRETLAITLRTPGQDAVLALGLLFAEGIIGRADQVVQIEQKNQGQILLRLHPEVTVDLAQIERRFSATASCGLCGKTSTAALSTLPYYFPRPASPRIDPEILLQLAPKLRAAQKLFQQTGGIHAAGLFNSSGQLLLLQEDVGRHNALDKLIGTALQKGLIPLRDHIILLSGRVGYELVQKAAMTGLPILAAVGAPTSLAIELAQTYGMTLIGFLREGQFNVYGGEGRFFEGRGERGEERGESSLGLA